LAGLEIRQQARAGRAVEFASGCIVRKVIELDGSSVHKIGKIFALNHPSMQ
jgi:hypothetical protein